ncbi:DNA repair ATPase [Uliginosibacterium sp. IMCC34675]|uniref:DNA repair ATPase n=2 Tax=Uliginosibacterium aquaticum TaxID=2731212 RepID=A0ABX2ILZ0_9RHOO|nr:DNA repair ATPase [Uliginosibacterium aquaticum]
MAKMDDTSQTQPASSQAESMLAGSSSYDLLKKRLSDQGDVLLAQASALNAARVAAFGKSDQALILRARARTENNCVARDIVRIGELLLFGFNVTLGLRRETAPGDVFALYRLASSEGADELESVPLAGSFLEDTRFGSDFRELYAYYKQAQLIQLRVTQDKLLAAFRIGAQLGDVRVFRWNIDRDGALTYLDNRGERDMALPPTHDFEWIPTTREDHVGGKHPHVNILDTVFVETVGGDLTIKIENNSETGLGIHSEPVEDRNQSLADAEIAYARLGSLILLRVRPYREQLERYLVYNIRTQQVLRIDAIGKACVQLPEDHGIIFPGGYYLQSGESKRFDMPGEVVDNLRFKRMIRSPNGEDVLYVFYAPGIGHYGLFTYNLINKSLATPILSNGYARYPDGRVLVFMADSGEPTRVHPMQLWQTPFCSEEHAAASPKAQGFFGRVGNAELVRGISELMAIARALREQTPTRTAYEDLIRQCVRVQDAYFWLDANEAGGLLSGLKQIAEGARQTLDEFEKVDSIRRESAAALTRAQSEQRVLMTDVASMLWHKPDDFVQALSRLREQRGKLLSLRELRYVELGVIDTLDADLAAEQGRVGERAVQFLAGDAAFNGYREALARLASELLQAGNTSEIDRILAALDQTASGLDLLTEQLGSLPGGDAVMRTRILDQIGAVYAEANRLRAEARRTRKGLGATESAAEFGAQFKLFGQAVENALDFADTPEKCDDALTRLLAQLEELEGRFIEQEAYIADIASKRESVYEAITARKQSLLEARQRRSQALVDAAERILEGVQRRVAQLIDLPAVHSYFAGDPLLGKLRKLIEELRAMNAAVAADELDTRLKTARDQAQRAVRDRAELVSDGGNALRLGKHAFTVSRQALDITLAPRDGSLFYHLTGTDYFAPVADARLDALKAYWQQSLISESAALYRAEYLAGSLLESVLEGRGPVAWDALQTLCSQSEGAAQLAELVRKHAAERYQEGYQKGVHDSDALQILTHLVGMQSEAGLLAFGPLERAWAQLFWFHGCFDAERDTWARGARAAEQMRTLFGARASFERLVGEVARSMAGFMQPFGLPDGLDEAAVLTLQERAAEYLVSQLASERGVEAWVIAAAGEDLAAELVRQLERAGKLSAWQQDLAHAQPAERWALACEWLRAFDAAQAQSAAAWVPDAAIQLAQPAQRLRVNAQLDRELQGLLGEHPRIVGGVLRLNLNDFWQRYIAHCRSVVPAFTALQALRQELIGREKTRLRLAQFQAKPLATFVRNRLIDEVYLPIVGDNLAKQLGTVGEGNRTDRMGMLLLISPPGYGKTTLMEYVADRLGLVFVRINCPVLGHEVTGLDPASAAHAAARQELEKLNLGLAMGSNVMLYLDDIQHTSPEFLQKFIALADGTRRIEGVWDGQPRTYDMRGKRFAVVMAGNPYTESGDVFRIPDMLANRADIYNLGDVLAGREAVFALSYIENAITANPVLLPLASRDPKDVHRLVRLAEGEEVPGSEFSHAYSAQELDELTALLQRLFRARNMLLKVNASYIASAAQQEDYRSEPPFKLQGSYRNMSKLAARITPLMTEQELDSLLRDHYRGEAQTLTTGAEENLLKLAHLLEAPTPDEQARWQEIRDEFMRLRKLGGSDDGSTRIANTVLDLARAVDGLKRDSRLDDSLRQGLTALAETLGAIKPKITITNAAPDLAGLGESLKGMTDAYDRVLLPLVTATYHKMKLDHTLWEEMKRMSGYVEKLEKSLEAGAGRSKSGDKA